MHALVLGANGYGGRLLTRLLANHPHVQRVTAASRSRAGESVLDDDRGIGRSTPSADKIDRTYVAPESADQQTYDVVFSALPHGTSAEMCSPYLGKSVVIDLSADFRLSDPERYRIAYGADQPRQDWQSRAVYGLVEWYRRELTEAIVIANPGCYPTATLLPLLPLASAGVIRGTAHVTAMSGTSGAGRSAKLNLLLAERAENIVAYNPGRNHRHTQEIEEQLVAHTFGARAGNRADENPRFKPDPAVLFTPHLIPMKQGMAVTTYVVVNDSGAAVNAITERYRNEPFVDLVGEVPPDTAMVRGTNRAAIGWHIEGEHVILFSTIDNLWKGASGQAIQGMNVRFGFPETAGLNSFGEV